MSDANANAAPVFPDGLSKLVQSFDSLKFDWCFLREPEQINKDLQGSGDVDIWVGSRHLTDLLLLASELELIVLYGSSVGQYSEESFSSTMRFIKAGSETVIEIHCGNLKWRSVSYLGEQFLKSDIVYHHKLPYIGGASLLSILADRVLIRGDIHGQRLQRARNHCASLTNEAYGRWLEHAHGVFGLKVSTKLESWLRGGDEPGRLELRRLAWYQRFGKPAPWLAYSMKTMNWVRRILFFGRATTVCMLGTDGAGKSTTIEKLHQRLHQVGSGSNVAVTLYWGRARGNTRMLSFFRDVFNRRLFDDVAGQTKHETGQAMEVSRCDGSTSWLTIVAALAYIADYWLRYVLQLLPNLFSCQFILIDRGPLDISLMPGPTGLFEKLSRLGPSTFINVLCAARAETIRQRKQERSLEEIARQQRTLRRIVLNSRRGIVISTEQEIDQVVNLLVIVLYSARAMQSGSLDAALYKAIANALHFDDSRLGS